MSYTVSITSNTSTLVHTLNPQIHLEGEWEIALVLLETFNTIANVHAANNKFHYGENEVIELNVGCYEISDIIDFLEEKLNPQIKEIDEILHSMSQNGFELEKKIITIQEKKPTFQMEIKCEEEIDFTQADSIASLLGFSLAN